MILGLSVRWPRDTGAEFKKECSYTFPPPVYRHGVHRDNLAIFMIVIWLAFLIANAVVPGYSCA